MEIPPRERNMWEDAMRAIARQIRANLRSRKFQTGLTFLTLWAAALLITTGLTAYFAGYRVYDRLLERTHGAHVWLQVNPERTPLNDILQRLREDPQVEAVTPPLLAFRLTLIAPNGKKTTVIARDLRPEPEINRLLPVEGRPPRAGAREIYLDRNLARVFGLRPGDQVTVLVGGQESVWTVSGAFVTSEFCAFPACSPPRVYFPPGTLSAAVARADDQSRLEMSIGVRLRDPDRADAVLRSLRRAFPETEGYTWRLVRRYAGFDTRIQSIFLLVFALMTALVGGFLVANAIAGAIRREARQIGLLRAVGFTNRQLVAVYLGEYELLALVAAGLGLVGGTLLAERLFADLTARYMAGPVRPPAWAVWGTVSVLLLVVVLAAARPLHRIARLDTVSAIRRGMEPPRRARVRLPRLPLSMGYGLADVLAQRGRSVLIGLSLAVAALAMTVSLILYSTVQTFVADPVGMGIVPAADVTVWPSGDLAPDVLESAVRTLPEVTSYACEVRAPVRVQGEERDLYPRFVCGDLQVYANMLLEGRLPGAKDEAVAAYTIAHEHGWEVGDRVTLVVKGRPHTVHLVGIYRDTDNLGQMFILPMGLLGAGAPHYILRLLLKPGSDPQAVAAALRSRFGERVNVAFPDEAFRGDEEGRDVGKMLKQMGMALALLLSGVAALGVLSGVSMRVDEERRTFAILKALGMTPTQVVAAVLSGVLTLAMGAYLVGVPAGVLAARALFIALGKAVGLGPFAVPQPGRGLVALLPLLLTVAAAGAYWPAHRASRLPVSEMLWEE